MKEKGNEIMEEKGKKERKKEREKKKERSTIKV